MLRHKYIALAVLGFLQAADGLTTRAALHAGAIEGNPLVRDLGLWPAKLLALIIFALIVWRAKKMTIPWIACAVYALVVFSNLLLAVRR